MSQSYAARSSSYTAVKDEAIYWSVGGTYRETDGCCGVKCKWQDVLKVIEEDGKYVTPFCRVSRREGDDAKAQEKTRQDKTQDAKFPIPRLSSLKSDHQRNQIHQSIHMFCFIVKCYPSQIRPLATPKP